MDKKALIILSVLVISLLGGLVYGVGLSNDNKKEIFNVNNNVNSDIAIGSTMGTTTNNAIKTSNDTIEENNPVSRGNEVKTNTGTKTENKVESTVSNITNSSNKAENVSVSNNSSSSKSSNNTSSNNSSASKPNNNSSSNSNTSSKPSTPAHTHTWKDETKVVHHDEEGYWDTVVVKEAWVEEVPKYSTEMRAICNTCNADITDTNIPLHVKEHMLAGNDKGGHREEVRQIQIGVDKINHPAVTEKRWVVTRPAWSDTVVVGSVCSGCGAKK